VTLGGLARSQDPAPAPAPPAASQAAGPSASAPASAAPAGDPKVEVVERIVAKVNNEIITEGELERQRQQLIAELKRQQLPPDRFQKVLQEAETDLLREQIDRLLLVQKARDLNITVDQELSKQMAEFQLRSKISDPDKFQAFVREQTGKSFEDFKQEYKDEMLRRDVIRREVGSRITIPRTELEKYYNEHKDEFIREEQVILREIFLSTDGKDEAAVEKKAKELVERARKNENFGNLARDNSDAATAQNYGDLPPFKRGMLRKEIEEAVFKAERGHVTDPIRQPNGFLILKVEDHYQQGLQPFEAVENEIMEKLYMPRMMPALRTYLTRLREDAYLQIREGYADSGAAPGKDTSWKEPARLKPETVTKEEVAREPRRKRLFWMVPIPGTQSR
jgi:parvulin-like peptidyl-prolyl isomerase